jgi:hypothetical protein
MVQLHNRTGHPPHDYWKLDSGKFTDTRCARKLYVRSHIDLLSFEGFPLEELKLFSTQRALPLAQEFTTAILKGQLEKADNDATLSWSSEFPLGLRGHNIA